MRGTAAFCAFSVVFVVAVVVDRVVLACLSY